MRKLVSITTVLALVLGAASAQTAETRTITNASLSALKATDATVKINEDSTVTVTYADRTEKTYTITRTDANGMVYVSYEVNGQTLTLPLVAVVNRDAAAARAAAAKRKAEAAATAAAEAKAKADSAKPGTTGQPGVTGAGASAGGLVNASEAGQTNSAAGISTATGAGRNVGAPTTIPTAPITPPRR